MKVFVYFNLHKKCWSVKALSGKNSGKVIAHTNFVELTNCQMKVSAAGRKRVLQEQRKNVHAGVVGTLQSLHQPLRKMGQGITYNPYKYESFVIKQTEQPIFISPKVRLLCHKGVQVFAQIRREK